MDGLLRAVNLIDRNGLRKDEAQVNLIQTWTSDEKKTAEIREQATIPDRTKPTTTTVARPRAVPDQPENVLQVLRSEPRIDVLLEILKRLSTSDDFGDGFSLATPGPLQSQIINALVTTIVPVYWSTLAKGDKRQLVECLTNVAGLGALVARLKFATSQSRVNKSSDSSTSIRELLDVLRLLLRGDDFIATVRAKLQQGTGDRIKLDLTWKEFVNLAASGKIISAAAEAEDDSKSSANDDATSWLANGNQYAAWLGKSIASAAMVADESDGIDTLKPYGLLLDKALSIGYPMPLLRSVHITMLNKPSADGKGRCLKALLATLPAHSRRQYLDRTLRWLATTVNQDPASSKAARESSATAAILHLLLQDDAVLRSHLLSVLSAPSLLATLPLSLRRSCLVVLNTQTPDDLENLLERLIACFNDQLFIKHALTMQQEALAQVLLVTAGYIHRRTPMAVLMAARSSSHMQGVSNRLEATNGRARWLGMVVGTALSNLVDKEGMKMDFGVNEMRSEDAAWYLGLVRINEDIGTLNDFIRLVDTEKAIARRPKTVFSKPQPMPKIDGKPTYGPLRPPEKKQTEVEGEKVTEICDSDSGSDSGHSLKPYAKPDSDPEDSDEDATLVNRHKPRPPVYIRDLLSSLRATEDAERFQLGLQHAAPLVRRKTSFGREVSNHAEELARILCNLNDPFSTPNFDELRLQALIALILSDPSTLAPFLSRLAFTGEYSLAQRSLILTSLGLSGRGLAGLSSQDAPFNPTLPVSTFPSKTLPPHLHALYSANATPDRLEAAHVSLTQTLLQPLATRALNQTISHLSALKTRPTSTRLAKARTTRKPPPNNLARIFPQTYFFPLVNTYLSDIAAYGPSGSLWSSTSILLVTLLKTLALLLHASGPATLDLRDVTAEFWDLLLALRVRAAGDVAVMEALLFAFVVLVEVQSDLMGFAAEFAGQLQETQGWVEMVFQRSQEGGGGLMRVEEGTGEEAKVRTLAAALLVKIGEIGEAQRERLVGGVG